MNIIDRLTKAAGSPSKLARALDVFPQHITNWRKRGIPADRCLALETVTGIPCEEIRPDLNWQRDAEGKVTGYTVPVTDPAEKAA